MPVFPGQLRYIRKNLFHAVSIIDPSTVCGLEASFRPLCQLLFNLVFVFHIILMVYVVKILQSVDMLISLYENNFPMRFGVVLYSSKLIKHMETSSDDNKIEEDVSSSVISSLSFVILSFYITCSLIIWLVPFFIESFSY